MKKILSIFFLIFTVCFSKMNVTPYEIKNETLSLVAGERKTIFSLETNSCKITGLGNSGIQFEIIGNRELINEKTGETINLENIYLDSSIGIEKNNILESKGLVKFKIKAKAIKNAKLSWGYYSSKNLWLKVKSIFFDETIYIPIKFYVYIYESLKIETTDMDFGAQVIGEKITTNSYGATPGIIKITGHPGSSISIDYPSEVELKNKNGDKVLIELSTKLKENIVIVSGNGELKLNLEGRLKNSDFLKPGKYDGEVKIKVRYD